MRVWRITKAKHVATAFSGEGARRVSGRWNSAGVAMVYCSQSLSLAALELFVNVSIEAAPEDLVAIHAEIPLTGKDVERQLARMRKLLDTEWKQRRSVTQKIGDEWAASGQSAAMAVPSAVIDGEWNVLLNPEHPDATGVRVLSAGPFLFDERMFREKPKTAR